MILQKSVNIFKRIVGVLKNFRKNIGDIGVGVNVSVGVWKVI